MVWVIKTTTMKLIGIYDAYPLPSGYPTPLPPVKTPPIYGGGATRQISQAKKILQKFSEKKLCVCKSGL